MSTTTKTTTRGRQQQQPGCFRQQQQDDNNNKTQVDNNKKVTTTAINRGEGTNATTATTTTTLVVATNDNKTAHGQHPFLATWSWLRCFFDVDLYDEVSFRKHVRKLVFDLLVLETQKVLTLQTHTSNWIKFVLKNEQNFGVEKIQIVVVISMKNVPQKWRRKK